LLGSALVTGDRRLTRRARERGIDVLSTDGLLREIGLQTPAAAD
jgi:rRNA-processing protein FCF1